MPSSTDIMKVASAFSTLVLVGLASYLVVRGMPIPDWLTLLIGGAGGGGLVGIGHTIGVSASTKNGTPPDDTSIKG